MTGPAKSLTQNCLLALNFFVEKIERGKKWKVVEREGEGRMLEADHLVITIPSVQMLELFERSEINLEPETMLCLKSIRHTKCLAILGILDRSSKLTQPGAVTHPFEHVDWLSDNQVKGISDVPAVTIHASAEFSDQYWDIPDSEWASDCLLYTSDAADE